MKYFIVSGEASGDLHASNLMKSLVAIDKEADFRFFGGDLMQSVGGTMIKHYRNLAYMGFIPVLMHLRTIFYNLDLCKKSIEIYRPDVVILIDYPGFNLKIAKYVKEKLQIPVYYYISPKIWAWKEGRIKDIRKYVSKMLCILPFEVVFYKKHGYAVEYVGNPTVEEITKLDTSETFETFVRSNHLPEKPIIALLAGSRKQEIKDNLPAMLEAAAFFTDYQLVIAGAPGITSDFYSAFVKNYPVKIVFNQTYGLLRQAKAALVTSGTATLETAVFRIPQAVCYKTPLKYLGDYVWKYCFKVKYISLVNLIAGKTVVQELFNTAFSVEKIRKELNNLLFNTQYIAEMQNGYEEILEILGNTNASDNAANIIFHSL
ncbi:lipid-A-disaccharide synthase [Bacteroidia bacterium]|nr:lipid-A-disaccharide synthase [Bacteroidia bacterium]